MFGKRLDIYSFVFATVIGIIFYFILHIWLQLHQFIILLTLWSVMVAYVIAICYIPAMRLRMDQAGDNAYYLGLIFTLISMAFALYDFGTVVSNNGATELDMSGTQQIIANFGIALGTTILGIFLRIILNQMRIDPSEFEHASRLELAEAAAKVKANLSSMTIDFGLFYDEIRQRSSDVINTINNNALNTMQAFNQSLERASYELIASVQTVSEKMIASATKTSTDMILLSDKTQNEIFTKTRELTSLLGETAQSTMYAASKLNNIEAPPLKFSRRLEQVTALLETMGNKTENITTNMHDTALSANTILETLSSASQTMQDVTNSIRNSHATVINNIEISAEKFTNVLDTVADRFREERYSLLQLQEQSSRTIRESSIAHEAAITVLNRLTDVTRQISNVIDNSHNYKKQ